MVESACLSRGYGPLAPKWYPRVSELGAISDVELKYACAKVDDIAKQENRRGNPGLLVKILTSERTAERKPISKPRLVPNETLVPLRPIPPVHREAPISPEQVKRNLARVRQLMAGIG